MKRFASFDKLTGLAFASLAAGWLVTGCVSNQPACRPPMDSQFRVTSGVDAQNLTVVANFALNSLLESGILDRTAHHPAVLGIGRYVNNTVQPFDSDLLTRQISVALLKMGKIVVAQQKQNTTDTTFEPTPDFVLSGKVVQMIQSIGNVGQSTFVFQFSLSDSNNLTVWAENKEITKITARKNLGL
jgi:hypothetical protein